MKAFHLFLVSLLAAGAAHAQQAPASAVDHGAHHPAGAEARVPPRSQGEVRKVDAAQGKVTLRHGPLANLDMPAMTMVFAVPDKKLPEGPKPGDKVRFDAQSKDGVLVVTAMEPER